MKEKEPICFIQIDKKKFDELRRMLIDEFDPNIKMPKHFGHSSTDMAEIFKLAYEGRGDVMWRAIGIIDSIAGDDFEDIKDCAFDDEGENK